LKKTFEIRKPAGLAPGNWTCHVFSLPITQPVPFTPGNIITPGVNTFDALPVGQAGVNGFTLDTLNFHGVLDGNNIGIFQMSNATKIGNLGITGVLGSTTEKFRIVSMGYEVTNTTAPLVTQGIGTHYETFSKTEEESSVFTNVTGGLILGTSTTVEMELIPANATQALAMHGTTQWPAKAGAYTVVHFDSKPIPTCSSSARKGIYFVDRTNPVTPTIWAEDVQQIPYALPAIAYSFGPNDIINMQQAGSIYSGLPDTATLTVNLRVYMELVTGAFLPNEQNFSRLARKCAPFDPAAIQLYTQCLQEMPVAVPVSENGFGDWFMGVADKVLNFATPVLKAIPHPFAQGLGQVSSVAQGLTNLHQKRKTYPRNQEGAPAFVPQIPRNPSITKNMGPTLTRDRPVPFSLSYVSPTTGNRRKKRIAGYGGRREKREVKTILGR